mmetsp:Transcript_34386/g.50336  ORF Transcript_34386/g.50336 Transcript_34386/m.50336 type:complete len:210 (-) Transcript_34386:117-746(-)
MAVCRVWILPTMSSPETMQVRVAVARSCGTAQSNLLPTFECPQVRVRSHWRPPCQRSRTGSAGAASPKLLLMPTQRGMVLAWPPPTTTSSLSGCPPKRHLPLQAKPCWWWYLKRIVTTRTSSMTILRCCRFTQPKTTPPHLLSMILTLLFSAPKWFKLHLVVQNFPSRWSPCFPACLSSRAQLLYKTNHISMCKARILPHRRRRRCKQA